MKLFLLASLLVTTAFGQPPAHAPESNPAGSRGEASGKACESLDAGTEKAAFGESERLAGRLFLKTAGIALRYERVRASPALQNLPVADGASGAFLRRVLKSHASLNEVDKTGISGLVTVVGVLGGSSLTGPAVYHDVLLYRTGSAAVGFSALTTGFLYGTRSLGISALKLDSGGLDLASQSALKSALDAQTGGYVQELGDLLGWTGEQKRIFSRALREKVTSHIVKSVHDEDDRDPKLVAELPQIDVIDLIEEKGFASPHDIEAMRAFQSISKAAAQVSATMTPEQVAELLPSRTAQANLDFIRGLQHLLLQLDKELPGSAESPAKRDLAEMIAETNRALEVIRKLCELGN
jgi:hypothetical protein